MSKHAPATVEHAAEIKLRVVFHAGADLTADQVRAAAVDVIVYALDCGGDMDREFFDAVEVELI